MRVYMINSVCGIGSTGRICTDIADVLTEMGHEVTIAYGRGKVPDKYAKYAYKIGNELGVGAHGVATRIFDNHGLMSASATRKLVKNIEQFGPDVIILHNIHGYYVNYEILFKYLKTCGKRILWTLHDCWSFTGHCAQFGLLKCEKWKTGCKGCPAQKRYPASLIFSRSGKNFLQKKEAFLGVSNLKIITPSKWLAELVRQSFLKEYDVEVIPNGIALDKFKYTQNNFKEEYGIENCKVILGVASFWDVSKGIDDFIKLSSIIDTDTRIVIVGATPEMIKNFPDNIIGIEKTHSVEQLVEIYSAADYFFNPTKEDTYPTVNLEACACGTPVIAYKSDGSPEGVFKGAVVDQGDYVKAYELMQDGAAYNRDTSSYATQIDRKTMVARYVNSILGE